jgi:serine/threonine-protein kinase RsbW
VSDVDRSTTQQYDLRDDTLAARQARRLVRHLLEGYGVDGEPVDIAELLASELVTNAVLHGLAPRALRCQVDEGHLTVTVLDGSETVPTLCSPGPLEPHGRGLRLVDQLAERWGVNVRPGHGKEVWFSTRVPTP